MQRVEAEVARQQGNGNVLPRSPKGRGQKQSLPGPEGLPVLVSGAGHDALAMAELTKVQGPMLSICSPLTLLVVDCSEHLVCSSTTPFFQQYHSVFSAVPPFLQHYHGSYKDRNIMAVHPNKIKARNG
jgi:hypothetical protein